MDKDLFYCVVGIVVGFLGNIIAGFVLGPTVGLLGGFHFVRFCSRFWPKRYWRDLDGVWTQKWSVDSPEYERENKSALTFYVLWHYVAAEFVVANKKGIPRSYRFVAIERHHRITGRWFPAGPVGYYGAFQLVRHADLGPAKGKWCGFSSSEPIVRADDWEWTKLR